MIKKTIITFCIIFTSFIFCTVPGFCNDDSVTLQWDHSIDKPYLTDYQVYYGIATGNYEPGEGDRASHFSIDDGVTWTSIENAPPPIAVDVNITGIIIKGLTDAKTYYFAVTAVDTRGLESDYSNEVSHVVQSSQSLNISLTNMSEDNFDQCVDRRVVDDPFTVCWSACENAISYELKIAHYFYAGLETNVVTTSEICYTFNNLPKSSRHFEIKVRAVYSEGHGDWESSASDGSPKNWLIYSKPAGAWW